MLYFQAYLRQRSYLEHWGSLQGFVYIELHVSCYILNDSE